MIEIVHPGPLCTVQDAGRGGWAHLGVGRSGAADRGAYALANRLVGNIDGAAVLECTLGGVRLRLRAAAFIAITGAGCAVAVVGGPPVGHHQPVALPAGAELSLGLPTRGLRTYVAVRGGFESAVVMGSRSTDLLSGLGPPVIAAGHVLEIGADPGTAIPTDFAPQRSVVDERITIWPGPRAHWFSESARRVLVDAPYRVLPTSNRIGARLSGAVLGRVVAGELASEGVVDGAIQVPNDGQPLIFLADHPTTGGYPVIAVVAPGDLDRVAQARPGDEVSFRWTAQAAGCR